MDKIWLDNNLDLKLTPYRVLGTDCMQGFVEFNQNSVTLAYIQYQGSLGKLIKFQKDKGAPTNIFNTFSNNSVTKYLTKCSYERMKE